jgi:hypothetical protein
VNGGPWFRGRGWAGQHADDDYLAQKAEADRQRWSYAITDLETSLRSVDPQRAYEQHRAAYITTGRPGDLAMMLEYVTPGE